MTDERRAQLEKALCEKGKKLLQIVGDDLPDRGFISMNVWKDKILIEVHKYWEDAPISERNVFDYYGEIE